MYTKSELESLDYRELQKLAKSKNIRRAGKGATKKRLASLLWTSFRESGVNESFNATESPEMDSSRSLPLQEVPLETILPILSPKGESYGERKHLNIEEELNDSNKENNLRRLTFDVVQPQLEEKKSPVPPVPNKKRALQNPKPVKRVKIIKTPTNVTPKNLCTPKPHIKIVKTPANKTPRFTLKTPATTKTVALRLASSAKKIEFSKVQSKIPKLNAKKPPNFANIHQNAFEKMDSLWDVERQRVLRKRQVDSAKKVAPAKKEPVASKKKVPVKVPVKKPDSVKAAPVIITNIPRKVSPVKKSVTLPKLNHKETARQAINKTKPQKMTSAKDEQRTFLKGVRINKRFEMQMKNRGLM